MKLKVYYFQQQKIVKRSLIKLIQNHKKQWNLRLPNQKKHFFVAFFNLDVESNWMIGLTTSEVYNSILI